VTSQGYRAHDCNPIGSPSRQNLEFQEKIEAHYLLNFLPLPKSSFIPKNKTCIIVEE
jgi:hypothetical protein